MYTNAVAQATTGHNVLLEFEAFRASCSQRLKKADSLNANAVAEAAARQDVWRECEATRGVRRLKGAPDGLYTNAVLPGDDVDYEAESAVASSPNMFANAVVQATAGRDIFRDTGNFYLVRAQELVSLKGEEMEEDLSVAVEDTGQVPWILARAVIERNDLGVAHIIPSFDLELLSLQDVEQLVAGARDVNTQAQKEPTPYVKRSFVLSINTDDGASRSALSGPRTPEIDLDRGRLSSTDSILSSEQRQDANRSTGALSRKLETWSTGGAAIRTNPPPNVPTKDQLQENRKFQPKVLADKSKANPAKRRKILKSSDDEDNRPAASPPASILPTRSLRILQMKVLARQKKSQIGSILCLEWKQRDEAETIVSKESLAACTTSEDVAPRLDLSAQQTPDGHNDEGLRCTDPWLQRSNESQVPLGDQWSSNFVPLAEWKHGSSSGSEAFIEACLNLPESEMSRDEVINVLDRPLGSLYDPPNFSLCCAPLGEKSPALNEDHPCTPRGPAFVSVCQDFVMPPSSPPSPSSFHCASDWDGISRTAGISTRRNLNFGAQAEKFPLEESESVTDEVSNEPAGLIKPVSETNESSPMAERSSTGLELQVTNEESPVPVHSVMDLVPLAIDSTPAKELQIVPHHDEPGNMVVFNNPPTRNQTVKCKPRVKLDCSTIKMFKILMLREAIQDDTEQDKASWEQTRQHWQNRARRFISIMRQVQGSRAFSRWKGSVVDSVGGVFLTQNVSDFLSSNAFMALRARFPARQGAAKEVVEHNSTSLAKDQPPIEKESLCTLRPERLTAVELKKWRMEEDQRQKHASERIAALLSKNVIQNVCVDEALTDIIEALGTRLRECHIGQMDHDGAALRGIEFRCSTTRFLQPSLGTECTAVGAASASEDYALVTKPLPSTGIVTSQSKGNPPSKSLKVSLVEPWQCNPTEEAGTSSSLVPQDAILAVQILETEQNSQWSVWTAVIQEKFANIVQEESFNNLSVVGKEKVLATTLRHVLGKKQTTRELATEVRALKPVKLRPQRSLERRKTDNYRYRQGNVSFKLLSGEARAVWEAGFVMKSQKEKWGPLRSSIMADASYSRDPLNEDCVDWEAVRCASVHEIADVIKNRGMNHALAGRMKAFLERLHRDQNGSIDLEWIRKLPPEDAKDFLLGFRGVGLKSVECIRLLTLHHPSFPVDTNVGRIAVRLGWVPLEPLPEETQLHLLELYPIQAHIQQYIWPRICTLDQQTLYELHYQMITFGKVFCTKSKPNCNACPLRSECHHYASSYASAKLLLKGPEKQEEQHSTAIALPAPDPAEVVESTQLTTVTEDPCIPIIEEPRSPEPISESNSEDNSIPDIEEVPFHMVHNTNVETQLRPSSLIIELKDITESSLDLNYKLIPDRLFEFLPAGTEEEPQKLEAINEEGIELNMSKRSTLASTEIEEIVDLSANTTVMALENTQVTIDKILAVTDDFKHLPSQELVLLPPQSAPAPQLKNVLRLRTVHFVYELPDNHPLLFEMDQREPDDPCFYLLAIWSPDEVPETMPNINDDEASNPFAACENNHSELTVRGTLLIPCRTAMRGWFPLNGTYFQVNEVFADHASSIQPIEVPRTLLWSLRRRFVYFSTAVSNLFRDMSQDEIRCCFQKGYVCLRAFDLATKQPKPLTPRLHQSGAKIVKAPVSRKGKSKGRPRRNQSMTTQKSTGEAAPPAESTSVMTQIGL